MVVSSVKLVLCKYERSLDVGILAETTGCPKKMLLLSSFEFLTLGGVFLGIQMSADN